MRFSTKLLAVSNDTKTVKGEKYGILTGILYLAPHTLSGYQVCPKATEGCRKACLFYAGRGKFDKIQEARINKTKSFFEDRVKFMTQLVKDIKIIQLQAELNNLKPAIRLNGTSDIPFEKIKIEYNGKTYRNIFAMFPNIQFYDYTKVLGRSAALKEKNYNLTFSLSDNNDNDALTALGQGYNLAVVLDISQKDIKPPMFSGFKMIDGDINDIRFNDEINIIVGLAVKGDNKVIKDKNNSFIKPLDYIIGGLS